MSRHVARLPRPRDAGRRGCFNGLVPPRLRPERFAMVPEQLLEADLPATAVRLYGLLLRCPLVDGAHVQSRARLAERLHRSLDTVDRAVTSLVDAGWVQVAHRFSEGQQIANAYVVLSTPAHGREAIDAPRRSITAVVARPVDDPSVTEGAPAPVDAGAVVDESALAGASRTSAARGAALLRHGREPLTERTSSPSPPRHAHLGRIGALGATERHQRAAPRGRTTVRASDPATSNLVREQAREELAASGLPVTRADVTRRACELLGARLSRP